ncbi:hypothetical protein REB14_05245 [Chryseobacterium sp. ES2]|uniref:Trimeric autotransporter adhesin YadA-like head domain-containing protein n=1 Tax=Chryseobacterium metallicongregator TaxID=3073042 RepID=A0ABU1E1A8_9FLAO|nr:hypothetical protein [Chryseobacterium sp. ES2]MDR4951582.1 hypothetical protein [Chryseobacterium sp. ES2]
MKNKLLTITLLSVSFPIIAQVGININQPQATFDIVGSPSNPGKLDGVIAPRLTGIQLKAKNYTAAQTGAIVYVTAAETAPTGQTVDVVSPGYYYFDGSKWSNLSGNWRLVGNTGTVASTATLGTDIGTGNYLGTNDSQNLVLATQKNVKGILDINGTLQGGNANSSSGSYASLTWGSNNTLTNSTSSNIALGKDNTVSAQGNFPAVAIGLNNTANNGAKVIGNNNTATGANNLVFGNLNTVTGLTGLTIGNNHNNNGGIAIGSGNTTSLNNIAVGSANTATGTEAFAIGFSGQAAAGQMVYANKEHVFFNKGNGTDTILGINMAPTAATSTGAALQMKGIASGANAACTAAEEGAIRYNTTAKVHEGCNGSNWKALY